MEKVVNFLSSGKTAAFLVSVYVLIYMAEGLANRIYQSFPEWRVPYDWYAKVPEYNAGFQQGCSSGFFAGGNIFVHMRYRFERDEMQLDNPLYKQGWNEGFSSCRGLASADM